MNIAIIGLGLIGGSMAKAIKQNTEHKVFGVDIVENVMYKAKLLSAIDDFLDDEKLKTCDIIITALYPEDCVNYIREKSHILKKNALVVDCCGIKKILCEQVKPICEKSYFNFIGGHPMAGREFSGFSHSQKGLFNNASMIITPFQGEKIEIVDFCKQFFLSLGFKSIQITTPEEHDKIIALTSQMCHIISNAFVKSPNALKHKGFSAGSFRDLTRVAKLNEKMWCELFFDNKDNLIFEIDTIIENLKKYSIALKNDDDGILIELLKDGREIKEKID